MKKLNNNEYFEFDKILANGYDIKEDNDRITQKFANGHRKQFISDYTDCIITITLGTDDLNTTSEYMTKLTSGTYKYYSLNDKQYKEAQFIIEEKPQLIVEKSINSEVNVEDFQIVLLKAGD